MKSKARIHGISKKVKIIIYLSSILILCFINPYSVLAWSAGGLRSTIASIVVSMLMSSGAGVTNLDWLNQLNTAYGVESSIGTLENAISQGLLTESAGTLIDTGLSDAIMANSAYTDLGLDALFTTTADDALIQAGTVAATGGANIATEAIGSVTLGTVGQAFVAVGAGIGLGVLANHIRVKLGNLITQGAYINSDKILSDYLSSGNNFSIMSRRYTGSGNNNNVNFSSLYQCENGYPFKYLLNNNTYRFGIVQLNNPSSNINAKSFLNGNFQDEYNYTISQYDPFTSTVDLRHNTDIYISGKEFPSEAAFTSTLNAVKNGTGEFPAIVSPDIVGADGNLSGTKDGSGYNIPSLQPYYNPSETGLRPIDMDDYMEFAATANDLTDEDKTGTDQADNFKDFINPYLENQEPVVPEPDPDYTDPSTIPEQPDYTDKEPVSAEDVQEADAYTAPDLMDRFPFCIPNDILAIFRKFKVGRQAPYIEWNFKYDAIGLDYTFELDLSIYDDAAQILRLLELIAFVVGLGVATRKLIGA